MVARDVHSGAYRPEVGSVEIRGGVTLRCGVP
jgi:hypothetical protein